MKTVYIILISVLIGLIIGNFIGSYYENKYQNIVNESNQVYKEALNNALDSCNVKLTECREVVNECTEVLDDWIDMYYDYKLDKEFMVIEGIEYDCTYNRYNCADFPEWADAQNVFAYCKSDGKGDIHHLDLDYDGTACDLLQ